MSAARIQELLRKTEHFDRDERYMAVRDLIKELESRDSVSEASVHQPVRERIIKLLEDKSSDVSTVATKGLPVVVEKFPPEEGIKIVENLASLVVGEETRKRVAAQERRVGDEEEDIDSLRATWANGLKNILNSISPDVGKRVAPRLASKMIRGMEIQLEVKNPEDIVLGLTCLDILRDVLTRFADEVTASFEAVLKLTRRFMEHPSMDVRNRANACVRAMAAHLPDNLFGELMGGVVKRVEELNIGDAALYTYIQTIGEVSNVAGLRLAPFLGRIVPRLVKLCEWSDTKKEADEATLQLWENSLRTFDSITTHCPQAVSAYLKDILPIARFFTCYDPFAVDDELQRQSSRASAAAGAADDGWGGAAADDGWGAAGADGWGAGGAPGAASGAAGGGWGENVAVKGFDDDTTWKVRRAAVSVISAFVRYRSDLLRPYYEDLLEVLLRRFRERDLNVKEEVLACMCGLLDVAVVVSRSDGGPLRRGGGGGGGGGGSESVDALTLEVPTLVRQLTVYDMMTKQVRPILLSAHDEFAQGPVSIKRMVFRLYRSMLLVRRSNSDLSEFMSMLVQDTLAALSSADVSLQAEALSFLQLLIELHKDEAVREHMEAICSTAAALTRQSRQPKIVADALRAIGFLCKKKSVHGKPAVVKTAYEALMALFSVKDADQLIKEASIAVAAVLAAECGDLVGNLQPIFKLLLERLENQSTRIAALDAIVVIARSALALDVAPLATPQSLATVSGLLKKSQADLRHAAAVALEALVRHPQSKVDAAAASSLVRDVVPIISDGDMTLSQLLLDLLTSTLRMRPSVFADISGEESQKRLLALLTSPLLQEGAKHSLIALYSALVTGQPEAQRGAVFDDLLRRLLSALSGDSQRHTLVAVASVVARLSLAIKGATPHIVVKRFSAELVDDAKVAAYSRELALHVVGQIGQEMSLAEHKGLDDAVFSCFVSKADGVRHAASLALGLLTTGDLGAYLAPLLARVGKHKEQAVLLLSSLKEIILVFAESKSVDRIQQFMPHVSAVLQVLMTHVSSKDEGPRLLVSECLGRLFLVEERSVLPVMQNLAKSDKSSERGAAITALRFATRVDTVDKMLLEAMPSFLKLVEDRDLDVRREAMVTVGVVARRNVALILPHLAQLLPALYRETEVRPELIEEVDYGAFKEEVDRGRPLRLAAFTALELILQGAKHKLNMKDFIHQIRKGVQDKYNEVQITTYRIIQSLAQLDPNALLEALDDFPDPITAGIKPKLAEAKSQGGARAQDVLRALVVTVDRVMAIKGVELCTKFTKFHKVIMATAALKAIAEELHAPPKN